MAFAHYTEHVRESIPVLEFRDVAQVFFSYVPPKNLDKAPGRGLASFFIHQFPCTITSKSNDISQIKNVIRYFVLR
jgi:hypothetical protein